MTKEIIERHMRMPADLTADQRSRVAEAFANVLREIGDDVKAQMLKDVMRRTWLLYVICWLSGVLLGATLMDIWIRLQ